MKKKSLAMMLCYVLILAVGMLSGCGDGKPEKTPVPDYNPYPAMTMNKDKHLTVITKQVMDAKFDYGEHYLAVQALQGLTAKSEKGVQIFAVDNPNQRTWLADLVDNYGYTYEEVESVAELILKFKGDIKDNGYILYDRSELPTDPSTNIAMDMCIVTGYLPVARELEAEAVNEWGLTKKIDIYTHVNGGPITQEWIFDNYKDKFSRDLLFHYDPCRDPLRDYAVATNGFMFYTDINDEKKEFLTKVYEWAKPDIPVMGWAQDEEKFVDFGSKYGKYTIACDWSENLTVLSAVKMPQPVRQTKLDRSAIAPKAGKHYVALCFSDGDNMQWTQNYFLSDPQWFGSAHRGKFAVTWGASLNSGLLQPSIQQMVYNSATPKDEFVGGVSGIGYMNVNTYKNLDAFTQQTAPNMERIDTPYLDLMTYESSFDPKLAEPFGKIDYAKGFLLMVGKQYSQGNGSLYWSNGKPFLSFRDSLWENTMKDKRITALASRISARTADYTKIEGYSLVNVHCWNYGMDDLNKLVQQLGDNVEVVTAGQLLEMITKNCVKENVVLDAAGNRVPPVKA